MNKQPRRAAKLALSWLGYWWQFFIMSRSFKAVDFNEDHCPGQRIVERYNHTSDYQEFVYIDENGSAHKLFGGSDAMINALSNLIENRSNLSREATKEERELTVEAIDNF